MGLPKALHWKHDGMYLDDTPFDPTDFDHWEVLIDGKPLTTVPVAWESDGDYTLDLTPYKSLITHTGVTKFDIRLVSKKSGVSTYAEATFDYEKEVKPPFGAAVT